MGKGINDKVSGGMWLDVPRQTVICDSEFGEFRELQSIDVLDGCCPRILHGYPNVD